MDTMIHEADATGQVVGTDCRCRNPFSELVDGVDEVVLDVSDLPWTGQIGRTLALMEELPAGARLRHVNSMISWPLLAALDTRGYRYRLVGRKEDGVHLLIWRLTPSPERD